MKYIMKIMNKMLTKIPATLVSMLFFVLILGFAPPANAYSDKEIVDYINNNLAGASDAEIAAVASSFGVSASDISNAYQEVSGVDVSARAEEAFEQIITITDADTGTEYYVAGDSSNVYTAPTEDGAGGVNPIGTFDVSSGTFTNAYTNEELDITTLSNITGSVTDENGTITIDISGQSWEAVLDTYGATSVYSDCVASSATGCLETYLNSGANVSITNLTPAQRLACRPATAPSSVSCSQYAGSSLGTAVGIPSDYTAGNITYSIDSCRILTNVDVSACRSPTAPVITSFTSNPTGFSAGGGQVTLSWTTENADSCTLTSDGGLSLTGNPRDIPSYTIPDRVTRTTRYTLTCSGPGGTTTQ